MYTNMYMYMYMCNGHTQVHVHGWWFHVNIFRNKLKTSSDILCSCKSLSGGRPKNHPVMETAEKEVQDRTILFRNVNTFFWWHIHVAFCYIYIYSYIMYYRKQVIIYNVWNTCAFEFLVSTDWRSRAYCSCSFYVHNFSLTFYM